MKKSIITVLFLANTLSIFSQEPPPPPKHSFELSVQPLFVFMSRYTSGGRSHGIVSVNERLFLPFPLVSFDYYRNFRKVSVGIQADVVSVYPLTSFLSSVVKIKTAENFPDFTAQIGLRPYDMNPFAGVGMHISTKRRLFFKFSGYYVFLPDIQRAGYTYKEVWLLTGIGLKLGKYKTSGGEK